jgi:hypothetical protein
MLDMCFVRRMVVIVGPLLLACAHGVRAQAAPKIVSVFPLGGQRGTTVEVEIQGTGLEGSYAVWLGPGTQLEPMKSDAACQYTKGSHGVEACVKAIKGGSRATVRLVLAADARIGFHRLSLVSPAGLSGTLPFWVGPDAVIEEAAAPHNSPETAQPVKLPVAVDGRISEGKQLAHYAFEIAREQTLAFEVVSFQGAGFDPQLALYEAGGSYLDPHRSKRLVFHEEVTQGGMPANRRMTYHFTKGGRYVVRISNLFAQAGKSCSYLLRFAPAERAPEAEDALSWARGRLQELRSKSVEALAAGVELVKEVEPNDDPTQAQVFSVTSVLEGTIGRPGDIDRFRFKAKAGQKLAFEVKTPRAAPPYFNLRMDVLDGKGTVVLSNLRVQDGKVGTVDSKVIQVSSGLVGKLEHEGEYSLRIRDLSSLQGSPDHVYWVLARPQIPHVGDVRVQPEGPCNLPAGARQRLTLSVQGKEDYAGTPALSVEGLPQGVRAFVGANGSTIDLVADAGAQHTPMPQVVRIFGLPTMGEKSGAAFLAAEIPVMVVKK